MEGVFKVKDGFPVKSRPNIIRCKPNNMGCHTPGLEKVKMYSLIIREQGFQDIEQ